MTDADRVPAPVLTEEITAYYGRGEEDGRLRSTTRRGGTRCCGWRG